MNTLAPIQRIGRRRIFTMYPGYSIKRHSREAYSALSLKLLAAPCYFYFPSHLPFDLEGIPLIPGGIQYTLSAALEEMLGIRSGMGKFALLSGDFQYHDDDSYSFFVRAPEDATCLLLLVAWAPDLPPTAHGLHCLFAKNSDASFYHRNEPQHFSQTGLYHGSDIWVLPADSTVAQPLLREMSSIMHQRLGDCSPPLPNPNAAREELRHLIPLLRRQNIQIEFAQDFAKLSHYRTKWFVRYNEAATQSLINLLYARAFDSALGHKLPLGPENTTMALARVLR